MAEAKGAYLGDKQLCLTDLTSSR